MDGLTIAGIVVVVIFLGFLLWLMVLHPRRQLKTLSQQSRETTLKSLILPKSTLTVEDRVLQSLRLSRDIALNACANVMADPAVQASSWCVSNQLLPLRGDTSSRVWSELPSEASVALSRASVETLISKDPDSLRSSVVPLFPGQVGLLKGPSETTLATCKQNGCLVCSSPGTQLISGTPWTLEDGAVITPIMCLVK